ncbi:MAG: GDP-mannose 4,6-dehydratase, partial [Candidatus Wildermuthbacteria bacterium]|nr:GDP-mannose 4,6-dehydratase [Candidatus Wildermuthbacteria bacterium]
AKKVLGWEPRVTFKDLARIMVDLDMKTFNVAFPGEGLKILQERFPHHLNHVHGS